LKAEILKINQTNSMLGSSKRNFFPLHCSAEFGKIMEISLKVAVDALVDDMEAQSQSTGASLTLGMPLAKLLSRVLQIVPSLLGEASQNQIIQIIRNVPEVELFFTLLYANNLLD
jgi:peroxin-3